jgi:hypothetical protein
MAQRFKKEKTTKRAQKNPESGTYQGRHPWGKCVDFSNRQVLKGKKPKGASLGRINGGNIDDSGKSRRCEPRNTSESALKAKRGCPKG